MWGLTWMQMWICVCFWLLWFVLCVVTEKASGLMQIRWPSVCACLWPTRVAVCVHVLALPSLWAISHPLLAMWHTHTSMPLFAGEIFRRGGECKAVSWAAGPTNNGPVALERSVVLPAAHFWGRSSDVERMAEKRERGKNKVRYNGEQADLWVCRLGDNGWPNVEVA